MAEIFFIVIFSLALYCRTIRYGLVMDDFQWWQKKKLDGMAPIFVNGNGLLGSLKQLAVWVEDRLYGGTTFGTNLILEKTLTVVLHTVACLLIYLVLGKNSISFCAAVLYACNPINNQTSCWLNGRRYLINVILVLVIMSAPFFSILLYPLALFLQVTAFFSPILLFSHSPWFVLLMPVALIAGWRKISNKCMERSNMMAKGDLKTFKWTRAIVVVKTFGFFFWKMLIPGVCAMQYPDRIKWGLTKEGNKDAYRFDKSFFIGIGAIVLYICCLMLLPSIYRPMAIFMGLAILQWSAVLPITQILSDRYCSLPNVFMMFFVSYFIHMAGIFYYPIFVGMALYYIICLSVVMPMYRDLTAWYTYHFKYFPALSWYRHNLIQDLMNEGNREMALQQTIEGLMHDRKDFRLLMWGAIMSTLKGNFKEAEDFLDEAERNVYLNKEEEQIKEISHIRLEITKLKPIYLKTSRLTENEKAILFRKRGIRPLS